MTPPEDERPNGWRAQEIECVVLGKAIRETRARREISQETLGRRANLHRNYVGAIERGEINSTFRSCGRSRPG
jgi:DNA-binding XRE family transcriptional regulator